MTSICLYATTLPSRTVTSFLPNRINTSTTRKSRQLPPFVDKGPQFQMQTFHKKRQRNDSRLRGVIISLLDILASFWTPNWWLSWTHLGSYFLSLFFQWCVHRSLWIPERLDISCHVGRHLWRLSGSLKANSENPLLDFQYVSAQVHYRQKPLKQL